jgi:ketosteroid isomerase-like protein
MKKTAATLFFWIGLIGLANIVSAGEIDIVRARVFAWCQAWQNLDIDSYMSFYSPAFQSKGLDYKAWQARRAKIFQRSRSIEVQISDLWVVVEGTYAVATFTQRYHDQIIADVGEKKLVLVNSDNSWQIVTEEWKPLAMPNRPALDDIKAGNPAKLDPITPKAHQDVQALDLKESSTGKTVVKDIAFRIENGLEKVFISLNQYSIPRVLTLEGEKPRIVLDIMNVSFWNGRSEIPINGKSIRQIRTYLHRDIEMLRIVLDLNAAEDYVIDQLFNTVENTYCIAVQ